jgi:Xaa-Pro dipeptidase
MPGANMMYLTGLSFHLMERPTVAFFPARGQPAFVLPSFEAGKLVSGPVAIDWQPFPWTDEEGPERAFAAASQALALSGRTLAVEELVMRVRELRRSSPPRPVCGEDAGPLLAGLRMCKDEAEPGADAVAVAITQSTRAVLARSALMTERQITGDLRSR